MLKIKSTFLFIVILLASCKAFNKHETGGSSYPITECPDPSVIEYDEFTPEKIADLKLEDFQIDYAFKIDSLIILGAYAEGDFQTSDKPQNWGDRLVLYKNNKIQYQSKAVGDVYLYEPHFYRNNINGAVIIICQLGYEYYFGGEAFLLNNGNIEYIGRLDIESSNPELSLSDIVMISEVDDALKFEFHSDSLNFKPGYEDILIQNNNTHYIFHEGKLELNGI